jgi:gluconokinase
VPPTIVIVMGVAGSGKTTVGQALAARLGWRFCDADDLHSASNLDHLKHARPLTDQDRQPWLERIRSVIEHAQADERAIVIACSALKERYRRTLAEGLSAVRFVFLTGSPALLRERLERRTSHVAGPALLESQLADLEPPENALTLDASLPVDTLVDAIVSDLRGAG